MFRFKSWNVLPLVALLGLTACKDATNVKLLEVDASGVLFGVVFLDADYDGVLGVPDKRLSGLTVVLSSGQGRTVNAVVTDTLGGFRMIDVAVGAYSLALERTQLGDSLLFTEAESRSLTVIRGDTTRADFGVSFPVLSIQDLRGVEVGKRVVTAGIALNPRITFDEGRVHIQEGSNYLRALDVARLALNTGDSVRLQGRTERENGQVVLRDVTAVVLVNQAIIPVPRSVSTSVARAADSGILDAALVRVSTAEILDTMTVGADFLFTIDDGSGPLTVVLEPFLQVSTSAVIPDTIFRVERATGLLVPTTDPTGIITWQLFPRSGNDVTLGIKRVDLGVCVALSDNVARNGDVLTVTVVLDNVGGLEATGVEVSDSLPVGLALIQASTTRGSYDQSRGRWTLGTVPVGASDTLRLRARVTTNNIGVTGNTATIRPLANQTDLNPANNQASASFILVNQIATDVAVEVATSVGSATSGDTIDITVLALNNGPYRATGVRISDSLPQGLTLVESLPTRGAYDAATSIWTIDTLHVGLEQLRLRAVVTTATDTTVINKATLLALTQEVDTVVSNDSDTVTILLRKPSTQAPASAQESPMPWASSGMPGGLPWLSPSRQMGPVQMMTPLPAGLVRPTAGSGRRRTGSWSAGGEITRGFRLNGGGAVLAALHLAVSGDSPPDPMG